MSLKEEIRNGLDFEPHKLTVDREHEYKGTPSIMVEIEEKRESSTLTHTFTFAKNNGMSPSHIAAVVNSYIKETENE